VRWNWGGLEVKGCEDWERVSDLGFCWLDSIRFDGKVRRSILRGVRSSTIGVWVCGFGTVVVA
jgi:hypothetical protein